MPEMKCAVKRLERINKIEEIRKTRKRLHEEKEKLITEILSEVLEKVSTENKKRKRKPDQVDDVINKKARFCQEVEAAKEDLNQKSESLPNLLQNQADEIKKES